MSELANRLAVAAWEQMKGPPYSNWAYEKLPPKAKVRVGATVGAVLREMARVAAALEEFGGDLPAACLALAEVVERGEQCSGSGERPGAVVEGSGAG